MRVRRRVGCAPFRASQRGQAVLFVTLLLAVGIGLFAYGAVSSVSLSQQQDVKTRLAMMVVRDALIGWSAARPLTGGADERPGELPCPDINPLDGSEDGSCAAGAIGRVPWKTLRIPEPKDETGETLWYGIAGPFRIWLTNPTAVNSDTKGNMTVYQDSAATPLSTEAVAIIFAAGAPLGTQSRSASATALCPTTGTTIAQNLCAANYLDSTGSINNATPTANPPLAPAPSFISAQASTTFNDRLLVITTAELMPVVEQRVARELRKILQDYKANTACACTNLGGLPGCYPWADLSNGYSDYDAVAPEGRNRGRIPAWGAAPYDWGVNVCGSPVPTLPGWFVNNDWRLVVYYSAGQNFLGPTACTTCVDPTLTVGGVAGKEALILMPGPLLGAAPRAPVLLDDPTYWSYYFEDAANQDFANDVYDAPSSTAYTRDRVFTIP